MKRLHSLLVGLMLTGTTSMLGLPVMGDPPPQAILSSIPSLPVPTAKPPVLKHFGGLPLSFESNQGQTDKKVRFLTHTKDSTLFLTPSEAVFAMPASTQKPGKGAVVRGRKERMQPQKTSLVALRMQMVGANVGAIPLTQQPLPGRINYLLGKDPSRWHTDVPTFERVGFRGVYPGVDLVYYGNQKHLEYDFVIAPHADPKQIQLHFPHNAGRLSIGKP